MKKLSELFEVRSGHCLELHELRRVSRSNGIAFVSRKGRDNGIVAYVARLPGIVPGEAGELTCALSGRGTSTILSTFLQDQPYYTGHHVARLAPKCPMMPLQKLY
ncbi:MAG TPA: hypothetical protein VKU02_33235, partial [Gemmataceae bacterium]|nr:hypothetical protein [Gemmataceae bacterium]